MQIGLGWRTENLQLVFSNLIDEKMKQIQYLKSQREL